MTNLNGVSENFKHLQYINAEKKMREKYLLRIDRKTDRHKRVKQYPLSLSERGYKK